MFTVELYAKIRHAVIIDGLSRRETAKRFGVHRNTITKMLSFSVPPGYRRRERPASKKLGPYLAWIDAMKATARFTISSGTRRIGFSSGCGMSKGLLVATRSCAGMWRRRCFGGGRCSCH
jgi:transposase